jgi:hypothetical protein
VKANESCLSSFHIGINVASAALGLVRIVLELLSLSTTFA